MSKNVYKLIPCNRWQIGEMESWLSDMAEEGLILKKLGFRFATFEKKMPKKIRYRLDYYSSGSMPNEQISAYEESGWKFCCNRSNFYIFSSPEDCSIPELHTDAIEQGYSLKALNNYLFRSCIFVIFFFFLILCLNFSTIAAKGAYLLNLLPPSILMNLFFLIPFEAFLVYKTIIEYIYITKLKKSLIEGNPINHKAPWQHTQIFNPKMDLVISIIYILILLFLLITVNINSTSIEPIPKASSTLPIVTLSEVEETPYIDWYNPQLTEEDSTHWYIREWSPLSPIHYSSYETGVVQEMSSNTEELIDKVTANGTSVYAPLLHNELYQVRFEAMADNVLLDLIKVRKYNYDSNTSVDVISKIENNDFDLLYASENKSKIFASRGKGVMYVNYTGEADFDKILEVISEKLKLIE